MLTVLQVNNYAHVRGGSDRYFIELSRMLSQQGTRVLALTTADGRNELQTPWTVPGFPIEAPRGGDLARFLYSRESRAVMNRLLAQERPDAAHLHIYYGQLTPSVLRPLKDHGVPVVQTVHEYKLFCPVATMVREGRPCELCCRGAIWNAVRHRCNRGSLARSLATGAEACTSRMLGAVRLVDHFIAVSDFVRNTMVRFGVPGERISTVHNFIDAAAYAPRFDAGDFFLFVGRVERIKGIMTLLAAMRRLPARLVVAGEGSLLPQVRSEAIRSGLAVEAVGFQSGRGLHDLIRGSRCVVVPSEWHETFGLVVLEAYALGKPVIASRMGGIPEVVREGETGLLFEAGNVQELAGAMKRMWTRPAEAAEMGRAGRMLAEGMFGRDRHCEQILSLYRKISHAA
jgi:glycosyltransferase involved in cell wall biosynthesis